LLQVVYAYVTYLVTKQTHESDKLLKSVIENQEIDLYKHVTELIKQNNFDTAVEVIEIIDKLEERRSK
ncbi:MAG: hypothetical protein IKK17_07820, partial [Oscillospiraceae bacterium]|nr:hypothetical protein [Oscillospiraceae bacterium]